MNIWIVSDTHFGHKALVENGYRPENHEPEIINHTVNALRPGDWLIHLGDVSLGKEGKQVAREFVDKCKSAVGLDGRLVLTIGNHDSESLGSYVNFGWDFVCDSFIINRYGLDWTFSHAPLAAFAPTDGFNVFGHLHNNNHRGVADKPWQILISMEHLCYRAVSLEQLSVLKGTPKWTDGRFVKRGMTLES